MAKSNQPGGTLAENLEVTSGLQAFRSIATGPREVRDSPFGRPTPTPTVAVAEIKTELKAPVQQVEPAPKAERKPKPRPHVAKQEEEREGEEASAEENEEKITVPLSQELRDQSEELARVINRNRSVRKYRITRNSIIRVALQCFLEDFALPPGRPVNSEVELLEAARSRRKK
jgi:hypothetical protein